MLDPRVDVLADEQLAGFDVGVVANRGDELGELGLRLALCAFEADVLGLPTTRSRVPAGVELEFPGVVGGYGP